MEGGSGSSGSSGRVVGGAGGVNEAFLSRTHTLTPSSLSLHPSSSPTHPPTHPPHLPQLRPGHGDPVGAQATGELPAAERHEGSLRAVGLHRWDEGHHRRGAAGVHEARRGAAQLRARRARGLQGPQGRMESPRAPSPSTATSARTKSGTTTAPSSSRTSARPRRRPRTLRRPWPRRPS